MKDSLGISFEMLDDRYIQTLIWVLELTSLVLLIFQLPQKAKIWGWRPNILDDLVKAFKNVSANLEGY